jgi:hypothetical protein
MGFSSEPVAGVGVGDANGEAADADGDQDDVQHVGTPKRSRDSERIESQRDSKRHGKVQSDNQANFDHDVARLRRPFERKHLATRALLIHQPHLPAIEGAPVVGNRAGSGRFAVGIA